MTTYAGTRAVAVTGVTGTTIYCLLFISRDLRRFWRACGSAKDALSRATPPFESEKAF
jgi:hypothetical protein